MKIVAVGDFIRYPIWKSGADDSFGKLGGVRLGNAAKVDATSGKTVWFAKHNAAIAD